MTEQEIIKYCQAGDRKAFKVLVDTYAPKLKGICLRYMKDEFSAQDVLQDSFIKIFKCINDYKCEGSFEGWMSKITVRSALQELRKRKHKIVYLENGTNHLEPRVDADIDLNLNENDILEMINSLPDHYRVVFNMHVIEGYSHLEISELLGIGESTSRTKLTRARKKIQSIYYERMSVTKKKLINSNKSIVVDKH